VDNVTTVVFMGNEFDSGVGESVFGNFSVGIAGAAEFEGLVRIVVVDLECGDDLLIF
jgi:hypothetical protein